MTNLRRLKARQRQIEWSLFVTGTLLIYAPVPLTEVDGELHLEDQACSGLRLWAENFERVIAMMPLGDSPNGPNWVPLSDQPGLERVSIVPVPMAYRADRFFLKLPAMRRRIASLIDQADYLSFAIGGFFGDWGAIACLEARRMKRPYAVWTDRVESRVIRQSSSVGSLKSRLRSRLLWRGAQMLERIVIRKAALGLFHGRETFDAYAPYCANPAVVHDIHIRTGDHISPERLEAKIAGAETGPLQIVYAGRADPMKGPMDWLATLDLLKARGIAFHATWIGEGSMRVAMQAHVDRAGLSPHVLLAGHSDHAGVLEALRKAHVMLFCHKTPESPRCLIEALVSGCPIVGYDSAFPSDLIARHGGGLLVARDDVDALSHALGGLASDRRSLAELIRRSASDGAPFSDVEVFRHRSDLIKKHLAPTLKQTTRAELEWA
jgi:glycosyltransferase involved in cell wall biosynthesis